MISGYHDYTLANYVYSFLASTFIIIWGLFGLNSQVNSTAQGPIISIMQAHSIFSIVLSALVLSQVPNM
jgi:hypothetical protein